MKKFTLTIGIPAHNEEANIANLLVSVFGQQSKNYILKRVIVICDGCTDRTAQIVTSLEKRYPVLEVLNDKKRMGKASRLNMIYARASTDLLFSLDADVLLNSKTDIDVMVEEIRKNPNIILVGARLHPTRQKSFWGKIANVSYLSFEEAFLNLNDGRNFYSLVGCASLIRKELYKSFTYPMSVISDQNYLYATATRENKDVYRLANGTQVSFSTVNTFHDWRALSSRSVLGDKKSVVEHFGEEILEEYQMPKSLFIKSLIHWFLKHPVLTTGSILMNIFIRMLPYEQPAMKSGIWEDTISSKARIMAFMYE